MKPMLFLAVLPALLLGPAPAKACGGFFCSQTPVLQARERVVFEVEGDLTTAYVQIFYTGDDRDFAWIVPVPEVPEVTVNVGNAMFDALEDQTRPIVVQGSEAPTAVLALGAGGCGDFGGGGTPPSAGSGPPTLSLRHVPEPDVKVWEAAQVGPYEHVTISAERASDLNAWLALNGYRVQPGSDPIVQAYLDQGMKLLALKLRTDVGGTAIEPVRLRYRSPQGCILPLRLTSIAAVPDMEVVVWVFAASPVAPVNVGSVVVDLANVQSQAAYERALPLAIDAQSDGQGFVTEFAQPTARLAARGDPTLADLLERQGYATRLRSRMDPSEMNVDPDFQPDHRLPDVSNVIQAGGVRTASLSLGSALVWIGLCITPTLRRRR